MKSEPVAQVCLYGTRESGFAYLASRPELTAAISAKGGWNADETRPAGRYLSLTEVIAGAKLDLYELGITRGEVIVFFPGGERCARTRVDAFEAVSDMAIEPAPVVVVSAATIASAARRIATPSAAPPARRSRTRSSVRTRVAPLGVTSSGKPIPPVPAELGALQKASNEAGPLFSDEALPAIRAANSATRAHFDSYASDFTLADHREAARLLRDQPFEDDRYLRFARIGVAMLHERFAEMLRAQQRREFGE